MVQVGTITNRLRTFTGTPLGGAVIVLVAGLIAISIMVGVASYGDQKTKQYSLHYSQAVSYQHANAYASALESYQQAAQITPTFEAWRGAGSMAQKLGNKTLALDYYNRALSLLSGKKSASITGARAVILANIKALQRLPQGPHR